MNDLPNQYEIRSTYYDINWQEKTKVVYTGAIEEQMRNLFYTLKSRMSPRTIRLTLFDPQGKELETHDK